MKTIGRVLGAVGLVFILSTPLMYFAVATGWNWLFTAQMVLGAAGVVAFLLTNLGELKTVATGRGAFYVGFTALSTSAVAALIVAANYSAHRLELQFDLTRARIFTLAPDSVQTVRRLPEPLEVLAFYRTDTPQYRFLSELVGRYREAGGEVTLVSVDPDREPEKVRRHNIHLRGNRVVARLGESTERLPELSEEALTNAMLRLMRGSSRRVYFATGHGEAALGDDQGERGIGLLEALLENEGIDARPLPLLDAVPEDAAALVLAGPTSSYLEPSAAIVSKYLDEGGRLLALLEPTQPSGLEELLDSWGVGVEDDLIVDQNRVTDLMGPFVVLSATYSEHPITEGFGAMFTLFPRVRSLIPLNVEGVRRPTPLVLTGGDAWGARDYTSSPIRYRPEADRRGPLPIALVTEKEQPSGAFSDETRLIVFGNSQFATNAWIEQAANKDLILNSLNWLVERDDRLTIRPRQRVASQIHLTEGQQTFLAMFAMNLLPLLLASFGVAVWMLRKNR